MDFLEFFSATSWSGVMVYVIGFILAIYFNLKVYNLDND